MKKRYFWMLLCAAAIVVADQLTKWLTVRHIPPGGIVPVWDGVIHLTYLRNSGMAFSLYEGGRWVFLLFTVVFLVLAVLAALKDWFPHPVVRVSLVLVTGGAVGNLIDRLFYGSVVDMIEVEFIRFAVFNVADIFLTVGAGLLLVWILFLDRKKPKREEAGLDQDHPM